MELGHVKSPELGCYYLARLGSNDGGISTVRKRGRIQIVIQVPDGLADKASYKADKARSLCMHVGSSGSPHTAAVNSNEASAGPIIGQAIMRQWKENCFDDGEM